MSKLRIIKLAIWGSVAIVPGSVLIPSSAVALAAHDAGARDGYGRAMVALIALGATFALAGLVIEFVAWAHALSNTRLLRDGRWFTALLWGGAVGILATPIFGIGLFVFGSVMTAYLVAGPDGSATGSPATIPSKGTIARWGNAAFAVAGAGLVLSLVTANLTNAGRPLHGVLWPSLAIESAGITAIVVGAIALGVAWWGALFNAHLLADKTWFNRLRWAGIAAIVTMPLLGLGSLVLAVVLIVYQRSAVDGTLANPMQLPIRPAHPAKLAS